MKSDGKRQADEEGCYIACCLNHFHPGQSKEHREQKDQRKEEKSLSAGGKENRFCLLPGGLKGHIANHIGGNQRHTDCLETKGGCTDLNHLWVIDKQRKQMIGEQKRKKTEEG